MNSVKDKNKLDLNAIINSAPKTPEPRTLREIQQEVGYPFQAVSVLPALYSSGDMDDGVGFVATMIHDDPEFEGAMVGTHHPYESGDRTITCTRPVYKRWVLLGHIPKGSPK